MIRRKAHRRICSSKMVGPFCHQRTSRFTLLSYLLLRKVAPRILEMPICRGRLHTNSVFISYFLQQALTCQHILSPFAQRKKYWSSVYFQVWEIVKPPAQCLGTHPCVASQQRQLVGMVRVNQIRSTNMNAYRKILEMGSKCFPSHHPLYWKRLTSCSHCH